jgi:lipid II:glycine glycyltransferase (peptidoglycan interpeptide bridge formation enzyme)
MLRNKERRVLAAGYTAEVDRVHEQAWTGLVASFDDANIYQTWPYAEVISGRSNMSHLVLKRRGEPVAAAQVRLARLPVLGAGVAYCAWGPMWRPAGSQANPEILCQALRALHNEYAVRRGLVMRLAPCWFTSDAFGAPRLLDQEGYDEALDSGRRSRTILMDLTPSLPDLLDGTTPHWKRELKVGHKLGPDIVSGTADDLFGEFIEIYREMVQRKRFVEPNDITKFRKVQERLPDSMKMGILLCRAEGRPQSGLIYSAIGKTALYLFGATADAGKKSRGSYVLQWRLVEELKQRGIPLYDLNGINPQDNPGTYRFKAGLAGQNGSEACFVGKFNAGGSLASRLCLEWGSMLQSVPRRLGHLARAAEATKAGQGQA